MFSHWLTSFFHTPATERRDPSPEDISDMVKLNQEIDGSHPRIEPQPVPGEHESLVVPGIITATRLPMLERDKDQDYIDKVTSLLRQLNGMLEDCPQGVSVMIELREPAVITMNYRPTPRIVGTVGKRL